MRLHTDSENDPVAVGTLVSEGILENRPEAIEDQDAADLEAGDAVVVQEALGATADLAGAASVKASAKALNFSAFIDITITNQG